MRPPARQQSALRAPLNAILGTEARVRVLRVLSSADTPITAGEIARRAILQPSGVRLVLAELVDTGIVEMVGRGKQRLAHLAASHPLSRALLGLFAAERGRVERIVEGIRSAALSAFPVPRASVWIEGAVATSTDRLGDPILVGVLAPAMDIDAASVALRGELARVESEQDITIEVRSLTQADLQTLSPAENARLANVILLVGYPPLSQIEPKPPGRRTRSHGDLDARALALARAIADKLRTDPTLVASARRAIKSRLRRASTSERQTLEEWDRILGTTSIPRLRRLLVDSSPRAIRLRQSLPFLDALSPQERDASLRSE